VELRRDSSSPEVSYPGGFKSTARNGITYRLYKLVRAQALESEIASCYEVKAVECAKEVKRLLNRKGIKARFFVEYPDVYVIRLVCSLRIFVSLVFAFLSASEGEPSAGSTLTRWIFRPSLSFTVAVPSCCCMYL